MKSTTRIVTVIALLAALAPAQSKPSRPAKDPASRPASRPAWREPPDDRYAKLLAGRKIEDGKGFPGVVAVGDPLHEAISKLGNGREDFAWVFWHFYDLGPWQLTVCTNISFPPSPGGVNVHAVIIAGEAAPATSKGVKVGDPVAKVIQAYGTPQPFTGALVGRDRKGRKSTRVTFGAAGGEEVRTIDDPPEFKDALFFPAANLLVAVKSDRVLKLAIVEEEDSLPDFLQPEDKIKANPSIKLDPATKVPKFSPDAKHGFVVPPPPKLVDYKGEGYAAKVPMGWTLSDGVWKDPDSVEAVAIRTMGATAGESSAGALFAMIEVGGLENEVPEWRRPLPASFCKMVGATEGACALTVTKDAGKEGLPLRTYYLMLTKGSKRFLITATRTQHPQRRERENGGFEASAFMGCPDGDALARGVMRGFKIAP